MRIESAEAGDDDFLLVGLAATRRVLHEQDVGRVVDPHAAMTDGNARGDIQAVGERRDLVEVAIAFGRFEHFDDDLCRGPGYGADTRGFR